MHLCAIYTFCSADQGCILLIIITKARSEVAGNVVHIAHTTIELGNGPLVSINAY